MDLNQFLDQITIKRQKTSDIKEKLKKHDAYFTINKRQKKSIIKMYYKKDNKIITKQLGLENLDLIAQYEKTGKAYISEKMKNFIAEN